MPRSAKLATSEALHEVKPLCIQLLKDQSKENVTILRRAIEQLSDEACQELHQYLLLPLVLVLKKENKHEALVIETIASIRFVLEKTCVNDEKLFSDIFLQLLIVVTTLSDCLQVSSTSEELKLEVCSALKTLIENAHPCVLLQFYDIGFRLRLSHGVTILIQLAEKERNRQLQVASMECLAALACNNVSDVFKSEILFQKVGGAFAGFFPGISLALTRVILSAENKSQNVTVHALKTWGHITHLILGDAYLEATSPVDEVTKLNEKSPPEQVPIIFRNEEWAKSTAEKLTILVDKVMPILLQCGERVKLATLDWARTLLLQCSRSLEILTPSILQAVLSLCADDSERVSRQGHLVLDEVGNQMLVLDSLSLIEILEEDFHKTLSRFPRLLRMGSESEKLTLVKLLCGYLKVFRAKISKILMSTAVSQKLLGVLFLLTELETRDMKIFTEQAAPLDFPTIADPVCSYRNQFVHFTDMQIFKEFTVICKLLATYGDVTMLTDILCQKIQESASHRKQAILVLSNILRSLAEDRPDSCAELDLPGFIGSLLGYFVSNSLWNLLLTSSEAWEDPVDTMQACSLQTVSLDKINSNILQSCLLLEGVTVLAQLSKEEFRPLLRICLCPLLEKAASQNHLVSHVACTTLFHVSNACGYRSISELIQQNADYIVNAVLFKLRHPSCHSDVTRIVQALAKHSDSSAISLLVDVGHEVLHALDFCHRDNALPFLKVLASIVMYLNTWFPGMAKKDTSENGGHIKATIEKTFVQFVEDFHHCKNLSPDVKITDEELESSDVPEENVYSMETDEKPPVPGYMKLLVEVLKRCMHLQSSSNIYVQTVVLSTISQAVVPLSSCEDELLPVVHLLWKPLVARFKKDDWNLSVKAFQTVMSLAEVARDFIRERVLLEVWPWLAGFLRSQHAVSRDKGKAYEVTAAFKYQLALLQGLGPLSVQLKVHEQGIALLASAVLPYLEQSQPPRLQEAATECLQGLSRCSADSVWYFVATTYSTTQTCWSPAAPLEPLPLTSAIGLDSNVTQLMAYLSNMDKQSLN